MLKTAAGVPIHLGRRIAKGGQGEVFEVVSPRGFVLKRYYPEYRARDHSLHRRIRWMVANPPPNARNSAGHIVLPWPTDEVLDGTTFVGFLMPALDLGETVELHRVRNPSDRDRAQGATGWLRNFTWQYLVATAANLARAVAGLHSSGIVIADFNDRNILVSRTALVTLLDCDSMQIIDRHTNERFLCRVGRPEFLAPELVTANLETTVRHMSSDLHPLAIHIYQLLMAGEHPYHGQWHGPGEKPPAERLARDGVWAHGPGNLSPRPKAPSLDILPASIVKLFRQTFEEGFRIPSRRPTASDWERELTSLQSRLVRCRQNSGHVYFLELVACPWCKGKAVRKTPPRPTVRVPSPVTGRAPAPATGLVPVPATGRATPQPLPVPTSAVPLPRLGAGAPPSHQSSRPARNSVASYVGAGTVVALLVLVFCIGMRHVPLPKLNSEAAPSSTISQSSATLDLATILLPDPSGSRQGWRGKPVGNVDIDGLTSYFTDPDREAASLRDAGAQRFAVNNWVESRNRNVVLYVIEFPSAEAAGEYVNRFRRGGIRNMTNNGDLDGHEGIVWFSRSGEDGAGAYLHSAFIGAAGTLMFRAEVWDYTLDSNYAGAIALAAEQHARLIEAVGEA